MNNYTRNRRPEGPRPGEFPLGSVQSRAAARFVQFARDREARNLRAMLIQTMDPLERAFVQFLEETTGSITMTPLLLFRSGIEKRRLFKWPLPTPEEVRLKGFAAFPSAGVSTGQVQGPPGGTPVENAHV
jgi:hypothetical protein